jgi:predicted DNA-binding protein (MmcQ/YjbR family)
MRNHDLSNKTVDLDKLISYGFKKVNNSYIYEKTLSNDKFEVIVIYNDDAFSSKVIDKELREDYILVDVATPIGRYAAEIKIEYEEILNDIIDKCFREVKFKSLQTNQLIDYVEDKYSSDLEFLWKKFPNYAICRNNINNKWYAVFCTLEKFKLGIDEEGKIDVVIVKHPNDKIKDIVDNDLIFKGYHMNKNYWISIPLDNRLSNEDLFSYIDMSYDLVNK